MADTVARNLENWQVEVIIDGHRIATDEAKQRGGEIETMIERAS